MADAVAFWSYVHDDNTADDGRIRSLATKLRGQYGLQTAGELAIFVDHESLEWGSEWSQRIDEAIAGTTFFIPIITPRYFRSQACRDELLKFTLSAERLGLQQLLMPVYWMTVPELENVPESSTDEVIKLVARHHRQDLRDVRLEDEASSGFRKAVSRLASELAARAATVTRTVHDIPDDQPALPVTVTTVIDADHPDDDSEDDGAEDDDAEAGDLEKLVASEEAWPELTDILHKISGHIVAVGTLVEAAHEQIVAAQNGAQPMKAQLVVTQRLASQLDEPAARIESLGHRYVEVLANLDPGVQLVLDAAAAETDFTEEEEEQRAEFLQVTQSLAEATESALTELQFLVAGTKDISKLSRSLRAPLRRMRTGLQGVLDGKSIIDTWGRRAAEIEASGNARSPTRTDSPDDVAGPTDPPDDVAGPTDPPDDVAGPTDPPDDDERPEPA